MARWTAVQDRLDWGSGTTLAQRRADVRELTKITTTEASDTALNFYIESVLADADELLSNPFWERDWDEDSETYGDYIEPHVELAIPKPVGHGALRLIELAVRGRVSSEQSIGVGQWNITRYANPEEVKTQIIDQYWRRYRLIPGV